MLENLLCSGSYSLALSPGFFQFYALTGTQHEQAVYTLELYIGVLHALEDRNCLRVSHASGSSAGAIVSGFLASGMNPSTMIDALLTLKREDIWDMGGIGGLLKGKLMYENIFKNLPVKSFDKCSIPLGVTAYEVFGFKTKVITSGDLATAICASCTFPVLFQPVTVDGSICIDGGVFDTYGLMALPGVSDSKLIVNVAFGSFSMNTSRIFERFEGARLLTLVMKNLPKVNPFTMTDQGPRAFRVARAATLKALFDGHVQQLSHNHWICYIDAASISDDEYSSLLVKATSLPLLLDSQQETIRDEPMENASEEYCTIESCENKISRAPLSALSTGDSEISISQD